MPDVSSGDDSYLETHFLWSRGIGEGKTMEIDVLKRFNMNRRIINGT